MNSENKKDPRLDNKQIICKVCKSKRGMIHKYGLDICRRCFKEVAPSIGFKKLS